jgi:hypothetical protein
MQEKALNASFFANASFFGNFFFLSEKKEAKKPA